MRAANLDNEVSSWQSGQHTAAQTFMLEFAGVFIRAESSYFSCCGFGHWTCAFYTPSDRERVAGKYDMSAFLPTKPRRRRHLLVVIKISFHYHVELPEMVVSIDSPRKISLRFAWGEILPFPSNE